MAHIKMTSKLWLYCGRTTIYFSIVLNRKISNPLAMDKDFGKFSKIMQIRYNIRVLCR